MQEVRPRGVTRNPGKVEIINYQSEQRESEVQALTCEVGHAPDESLLVWIIPMVDAVVDDVILRKESS